MHEADRDHRLLRLGSRAFDILGYVRHSLSSLNGGIVIQGSIIGVIEGETRSSDYSSCEFVASE